jgi:hypothetical protein
MCAGRNNYLRYSYATSVGAAMGMLVGVCKYISSELRSKGRVEEITTAINHPHRLQAVQL